MAYSIYLTNGNLLTTLVDGNIDQSTTNLALVGKNSTGYGVFLNDNFVHLLENFANTSQPANPVTGQLWFDTSQNRLKVYDGTSFTVASGTLVGTTIPSTVTSGEFWIDSGNGQLYFNDGTATTLAGPIYSRSQGVSGFNVQTIVDTNGLSHTALVLFVGGSILGIYSKDSYVPATSIAGFTSSATFTAYQTGSSLVVVTIVSGTLVIGQTVTGSNIIAGTTITNQLSGNVGSIGTYTVSTTNTVGNSSSPVTMTAVSGSINVGFNTSSYPGTIYNGLVTEAQSILASNGTLLTASNLLTTTNNNISSGTMTIQNNTPLTLGAAGQMQVAINSSSNVFQLNSQALGQNFAVNMRNSGNSVSSSIFINANTQQIGIYTTTPNAMLDVAGNVIIEGNLTVLGSTETINSTIINIADKNITLGTVTTPTDTTASGGGITLSGATSKFIDWAAAANTSSASSNVGYWNFSDYVNVGTSGAGAGYYVNGQQVVGATSLGSVVTSAPGLTSVGSLTSLVAANISVSGSTIAYTGVPSNGNITLAPKGTGYISANSSLISNVANPVSAQDAATKSYVTTSIQSAPLGISVNSTSLTDAQIGTNLLYYIFPPGNYQNGTSCVVQATDGHIKQYSLQAGVWTWQSNIV
jgi:hypothetical protein